jgi:prevent-host-death family protein
MQSLTTFRRASGDFTKQLKKTKRPVVLTVNGKAAAVVQDAEAYQRLLDIAAGADADEGIRKGLDDVAHGRTAPARQVFDEIAANMPYRVEFVARAARDLEIIYLQKNVEESQAAARWYNGLEEAIYALEVHPERCPIVPEGKRVRRCPDTKPKHSMSG